VSVGPRVLAFPVTNGPVTASAVSGSTLYVGGEFTELGPDTGAFASVNASTGKATAPKSPLDGEVRAIASDRHGGWFVGLVGPPCVMHCLLHILANGNADPRFRPAAWGVSALALSPGGKTLYVAGQLSTSPDASHVGAFAVESGRRIKSFAPKVNGQGSLALSPDGSTLYLGGATVVNGQPIQGLGAVRTSNGTSTPFHVQSAPGNVYAIALSPDGKTLYAAGDGGVTGGTGPGGEGSLDVYNAQTGQALRTELRLDSTIRAIAFSRNGETLYAGGTFTTVDSEARAHLAAFDVQSGALMPFDPGVGGTRPGAAGPVVLALATAPNGTVYVGGAFTSLDGKTRAGLAAVDASGAVTPWNPHPNGYVESLAVAHGQGNAIGVGGNLDSIGSVTRSHLAAIDLRSGRIKSLNPGIVPDGRWNYETVSALVPSPGSNTLYVGGNFTAIGGQNRTSLAAISATSRSVTSFDPNLPIVSVRALALSKDGSTLYVAGETSSHLPWLGAVATATGAATPLGPPLDGQIVGQIDALALSRNGSKLYVGGMFTVEGQPTEKALIAVSTTTGQLVTSFFPDAGPFADVKSLAVSRNGSTLYAGGDFAHLGGRPHKSFAALNADTGAANTLSAHVDGEVRVLRLAERGHALYLGGDFRQAGGQGGDIAKIQLATASATALSLHLTVTWGLFQGPGVYTLARHGSNLLVGGDFTGVNGKSRSGLARLTAG
jgi:WD40 repeat protein